MGSKVEGRGATFVDKMLWPESQTAKERRDPMTKKRVRKVVVMGKSDPKVQAIPKSQRPKPLRKQSHRRRWCMGSR